ncbi:hypothetical protein, partial [Herpetosiphon llansteffanensis]|uniref:hypothetical protein n=1 Tax=Herpetosiphon llansteffanensis TaxID=2094568 RepID=UPI0013DF4D3B
MLLGYRVWLHSHDAMERPLILSLMRMGNLLLVPKSARHALATTYGADGFALLTALTAPDTPRTVRTLPMVATLWR